MAHLQWLFFLYFVSGLNAVPILMSWTTSIKYFEETDTANITSVTPTTTLAIAVDYHYQRGELYFSDGLGRIYRGWLRSKDYMKQPIVIAEVKLSDGLAVDWVNDNLYWTDITKETVEMATLDGLYRRTLFNSSDGVKKPRAIVLDPFEGLLFWSDWGNNARVESSGLDGNSKKTITTSDLIWPNGLALDLDRKKVYILDGFLSTISSCNYDGSNRGLVIKSHTTIEQTFGLTYFDRKLYWGSWRSRTLFAMDIPNTNIDTVYKRTDWRGIKERMMGVKAVHPNLQKQMSKQNPCTLAGCSHRCLTGRSRTTTCICQYGFKLHQDGKTCIEEGYIIVSWRRTIRRYTLTGAVEEPLFDAAKSAVSLDYHFKKSLLFWSDIEEHRIYRAPLGQLNNKTVIATTETCDGLAVDWVHDILYWTDTQQNTLEAASLDGSNHMVIFSNNLDEPRDIALDPFSGIMFWTDWGTNPEIERADLDGSDRKTIIDENIAWPNGITIDFDTKRLYWVDGKLGTISSCLYDGSGRKQVLGTLTISQQPFSISLLQDEIYWTDWRSQAIFKADKNIIIEVDRLANSSILLLRPNGIKAVHSSRQKEQENPCVSLRCQGLCLGSTTPQSIHCIGEEIKDPEIDIRFGAETQQIVLTNKVFNNSIHLSVQNSKAVSLAVITTKCIRRDGCEEDKRCSQEDAKVHVFTNQTSFNISGLLPGSHYDVDFKSPEYNKKIQLVTLTTDPPEMPKVQSAEVIGNNVTVKWDPVDTCVPGFTFYHYKLFKKQSSNTVQEEGDTSYTEVYLSHLEPKTDFIFHLYTYNPEYFSSFEFSTNSGEPVITSCMKEELLCDGKEDCPGGKDEDLNICAAIESVNVYKKSNSEVYLRCQVTNITKNQLEKFVGTYQMKDSVTSETLDVAPIPCVMWPTSYCIHISSLKKNKEYNFNISVSLKSGKVGNPLSVSALTKEGVSGPPEDVLVTSYTPTTVEIQWHYPNQSNGIIRNFIINIHEVETFEEGLCCQSFPIIESPVKEEKSVYNIEAGGLSPASTYAITITAKTMYVGGSTTIDVNTPPAPIDIMRQPQVLVSSLLPLSWQPNENPPSDQPQYHHLIKSYLLLLMPSKTEKRTNIITTNTTSLSPLQELLKDKLEAEFVVLWNKNADDTAAFLQPVQVKDLVPRTEYQLAWVQVSQYKDVYSFDYIKSHPFMAV